MQPIIDGIFDEADSHFLKNEGLSEINRYVKSLPERITAYRMLRDREIEIMQKAADQLESTFPDQSTAALERSISNALLLLRHAAMAMLMNDERFLQDRLLDWLGESIQIHGTLAIDTALQRLLAQQLERGMSPQHMSLLNPFLQRAQAAILPQPAVVEEKMLTVAGLF
jgi:vacuolar-type H+-ATPase subunit E/Vma4